MDYENGTHYHRCPLCVVIESHTWPACTPSNYALVWCTACSERGYSEALAEPANDYVNIDNAAVAVLGETNG